MQDEPDSGSGGDARSAIANGGANGDAGKGDAEIVRLRRRLAFYEGFDDLIQQNISRSGDLLRLAAERQAEAERELAAERENLLRAAAAQREVLDALAADLASLRRTLDALAARVESARDGIPTGVAPGQGRTAGPAPLPVGERAAAAPGSSAQPQPEPAVDARAEAAPAAAAATDGHGLRSGSVVVHGIAGVEDARSYQTWLASCPGVHAVTPREFAAGILRLDVAAEPFPGADAAGWPGHALEVVDLGPGATVLRLRGAVGL